MFARSGDDFSCHLDTLRVNDREPLPTLIPVRIVYRIPRYSIRLSLRRIAAQLGGRSPLFDEERAANIGKLPDS